MREDANFACAVSPMLRRVRPNQALICTQAPQIPFVRSAGWVLKSMLNVGSGIFGLWRSCNTLPYSPSATINRGTGQLWPSTLGPKQRRSEVPSAHSNMTRLGRRLLHCRLEDLEALDRTVSKSESIGVQETPGSHRTISRPFPLASMLRWLCHNLSRWDFRRQSRSKRFQLLDALSRMTGFDEMEQAREKTDRVVQRQPWRRGQKTKPVKQCNIQAMW